MIAEHSDKMLASILDSAGRFRAAPFLPLAASVLAYGLALLGVPVGLYPALALAAFAGLFLALAFGAGNRPGVLISTASVSFALAAYGASWAWDLLPYLRTLEGDFVTASDALLAVKALGWLFGILAVAVPACAARILPASWEARGLSLSGKDADPLSAVLCYDLSGREVRVSGPDRFLHTLVVGPTGSGKTASVNRPLIFQDLVRIARGQNFGLTVVEPSGDLTDSVAEACRALGIPFAYIHPMREESAVFNPMEGDPEKVAETTRTALRNVFGRQEAFFAAVQEMAARNTILLLKRLRGDDMDLADVLRVLQNLEELRYYVREYSRRFGEDELVGFFETEVFGKSEDKFQQFAMGLRLQLGDIAGNPHLARVLSGRSTVQLDDHLRRGGVLLVCSAMGLGRVSDVFGQFFVMHFQNAVFRLDERIQGGAVEAKTVVPHALYIDEFPRYVNPDFDRMLSIARKYRLAVTLSIQNLDQMDLVEKPAFEDVVLNNCRNQVYFGGIPPKDAKRVEALSGLVRVRKEDKTYHWSVIPEMFPKSYRETEKDEPRIPYTRVMELPAWHVIYRVVKNGVAQPPQEGLVKLAPPVDELVRKVRGEKAPVLEFLARVRSGRRKAAPPGPGEPVPERGAAGDASPDAFSHGAPAPEPAGVRAAAVRDRHPTAPGRDPGRQEKAPAAPPAPLAQETASPPPVRPPASAAPARLAARARALKDDGAFWGAAEKPETQNEKEE